MKGKIITGLIIATLFQFFILTGMYVKAALPLWTGQEIKVKTIPVDPRSLFRGNYARLSYDFSRVTGNFFNYEENLKTGDIVYITLKPGANNLYVLESASSEKPLTNIFIRGRVLSVNINNDKATSYHINYGIDAFFAPKEKALSLEKDLRDGGIATLMVAKSGRARIKNVSGK